MANPYTSIYMPSGFLNDQTGLSPVFQNIGAQQSFENQQIAAQNQLGQQASQAFQNNGQASPMALAQALRQGQNPQAQQPGTGTTTGQDLQNYLSSMNPYSNYNQTNGVTP
jgi:hypothetical protein